MIATGVNAKALSTYMGHANAITLDLYGHLMPGSEDEAAEQLLNAYLEAERERSDEAARGARGKTVGKKTFPSSGRERS